MRTLIAGAGRFGTQIAQVFAAADNEVTLVDQDDERIAGLTGAFPARLVDGDACDPGTLEEAGILGTDLLIAATGDDEDNLVISLLAKRTFAVPRVAARVNDPENTWLFDERWGVDVAVPASAPLISLIQEASGAVDTVALLRLSHAGITVIETVIGTGSHSAGQALEDVALPPGTLVAALIRDGNPVTPGPGTVLRPGDELLILSPAANADDIRAAFQ
jgi:trk system potassium uptake protein TrkA